MLVLCAVVVRPVLAQDTCRNTGGPGATLLFPYVEVDVEDPEGRTTFLSVSNTAARPVLTHVVLWTNRGLPVLDFDLFLPPRGVKPIDLRDLIVEGRLPVSGAGGGENPFPSCGDPVAVPDLDTAALEELQTRLTGAPDPDGLCWADPVPGSPVTAFVTVDAVRDCAPQSRHPLMDGYFADEGGAAADDDVLWGDFFLVDDSNDAAQGLAAVAIRAAGPATGGRSFYGRGETRRPMPARYRHRFFEGGAFDGGTEVLVWVDPFDGRSAGPMACGAPDHFYVHAEERSESGALGNMRETVLPRVTHRFPIVASPEDAPDDALPVAGSFGTLKVCASTTLTEMALQAENRGLWAAPIHTALGRFSVGLDSVSLCEEELPEHPIAGEVPEWVRRWISAIECQRAVLPGHEVRRYRYQGDTVYFRPGPCCDMLDRVFDEEGEYLCAPSGGFTGDGDGQCPDFFDVATDEEMIWQDPRYCELVVSDDCPADR